VGERTAQLQDVLRPSFRATAWLGVLGALAGTALAEPLCRLVYGEPFAAAAPAFAVLSWLLPISLLGAHARFALIAYSQQRSELAANAVGAAVAVGLGLIWIPPFGAVGAAAAMLASGFATWGVAQAFARRHLGRVPFLGPLARPALVAAGALALSSWLPLEGRVVAGLVAIGVYVAAAPMVEPALLRDLLALWRARAETTDGGSP
jgi:O-antigen/teichoic acid export membrane protein